MDLADGDLLVVRTWNWTAEKLVANAKASLIEQQEAGDTNPVPEVSVYALVKTAEVSVEDLKMALCSSINRAFTRVAYTTDRALAAAGFGLVLAEPPVNHYAVPLTRNGYELDAKRLFEVFTANGEERNPCRR